MIKINLLPAPVEVKKVSRVSLIVLIFILVLGAIILPLYFTSNFTVSRLNAKKASLEKEIKELEPKVESINAQLSELEARTNAIDRLAGVQRIFWSKKINELAILIPDNVYIEKIYLTTEKDGKKILQIEGASVSRSGEERIKLIGEFINALKDKSISSFYYKEDGSPNFGEIEFVIAKTEEKENYPIANFTLKMEVL